MYCVTRFIMLSQSVIPGCVFIKNALNEKEQIELATVSKEWNTMLLPSTSTRNRVYDAITKFPDSEYLLKICKRLLEEGNKLDSTIIIDDPTHLLYLQYFTPRGMGFHSDNGKNDGSGLNPVVSISLGNSCVFSIKCSDGTISDLTLESGDVVMFGGPARFMFHAVKSVKFDCPKYLHPIIGKVRLNYTLRYAPEILGREEEFKVFDAKAASKYNGYF